MDLVIYVFLFIIGCFVGSFLNVIVDRLPEGRSFLWGRSECEHCHKTLGVWDLVPLISFVFLNGKCRYCHHRLSYYYPGVEVLTGLLFALLASIVSHQNQVPLFSDLTYSLRYIYLLFTSCCLLLVFFIDLKYGIIPFKIVLASFLAAVLWYVSSGNPLLVNSFLAGIGMFFFFLLLFVGTKGRGLGFGDVVFVALMGFLLGFPKIVLGIYVSFLTGALVSLILVLVGRKRLSGGTIPFGPFLVFGTFLALFWGDWIIKQVMVYLLHL